MKNIVLLFFIATIAIFSSCKKETTDPIPVDEPTLNETVFPSSFDWKTYEEVNFSVSGYANSILEVVSNDGNVYQKVFLKKNETYTGKFTMPTYETTVKLIYMGQEVSFELGNGSISHQFNL